MNHSSKKNLIQAIAIGAMAGSRTSSAPLLMNCLLKRRDKPITGFGWLASKTATVITTLMAVGELVADKLPQTPARIEPGGIAGRCLSGALGGAVVFKSAGDKWYTGALTGAAAAAVSSFAFYWIRKKIGSRTSIPDPVIGGVEDLLVGLGGVCLVAGA